ncbi:unnamed protein product [Adineta steineri]|uniref:Uncharacterized protein n=1 Tax=Adineta steineri TaxID=433720 RepID=A0A814MMG1_9BILA|nr:unnamed protein product [Adineta steineri]CAF1081797.1 unnamed protein product [Adineta steineri]
MIIYQVLREILVQCIGALVSILALFGLKASNSEFNGRAINQYRRSVLFQNDMIIHRFYVYETLIHHNFVVLQTGSGHTFTVHLIADVYPGEFSPITVEIGPAEWRPISESVKKCYKTALELQFFVMNEIQIFGVYEVGFNDCRHFARAVAAFLVS